MNILVTSAYGQDDVMIFDHSNNLNAEIVKDMLKDRGTSFNDVIEVLDDELEYYNYEPSHIAKDRAIAIRQAFEKKQAK